MASELTPTEELVLEVLSARVRLGEPFWPFSRRLTAVLKRLQADGWLSYESDITEGAWRVHPGPRLRREYLDARYTPPILRQYRSVGLGVVSIIGGRMAEDVRGEPVEVFVREVAPGE